MRDPKTERSEEQPEAVVERKKAKDELAAQGLRSAKADPGVDSSVELAQLREMVTTLMVAVESSEAQRAQSAVLNEALAEVRQAARSVTYGNAYNAVKAGPRPNEEQEQNCGCGCTNSSCCSFEIVLGRARASRPQIEIPDMGDVPMLINALEVQIYMTADGTGILVPGLATTMDLRASGVPAGPGPWVTIERVVNRIDVKKGSLRLVTINCEVREHDAGGERLLAGKDELGEGTGSITLDCCMETIYPPMPLEIDLIHGGEGRGIVTLAYYARRVCC